MSTKLYKVAVARLLTIYIGGNKGWRSGLDSVEDYFDEALLVDDD